MISCFPSFYPDELVYSVFARYYREAGYLRYVDVAEDLFIHRGVLPDTEFINPVKKEVMEILAKQMPVEKVITEHTMFPAYCRFLPLERRKEAYRLLTEGSGSYVNKCGVPKRKRKGVSFLRYCPICVRNDREKYAETYWHRCHQLAGVDVCPEHRCFLENSTVNMTIGNSFCLKDAEGEIDESCAIRECMDERKIEAAAYILRVFKEPVSWNEGGDIGKYLREKLMKEKYLSESGRMLRMELLYSDYQQCFGEDSMKASQLQKIFYGKCTDFPSICQIGFFEGIAPEEIACIPLERKEEDIYIAIAQELSLDIKVVEAVGEAFFRYFGNAMRIQYTSTKSVKHWMEMDRRYLPKVKRALRELEETSGERPKKVSVKGIEKKLSLPQKSIQKMPECRKTVLAAQTSMGDYWAKEVVWAYHKILESGDIPNRSRIRKLTNMRNPDFIKCKEFLKNHTDETEAETILCLL